MEKKLPLLALENISHNFGDLQVFQDFNLELQQGDSLVLVGPSGSGKSLLLKLLAGLVRPSSGQVLFEGEDLATLSKKSQSSFLERVGMLFQQNALFDSMTVYDNLDFTISRVLTDMGSGEKKETIEHFLEAVGLDHVPNLFPGELSGGMQKRLGIARALVLKPQIVFYDDPTAGLDPISSRKIVQMILNLKESLGATIVPVTHDVMRGYQLAGDIMVCFHNDFILTGNAQGTKQHKNPKVQQFIHGRTEGPLQQL